MASIRPAAVAGMLRSVSPEVLRQARADLLAQIQCRHAAARSVFG
jgi:hypothetical protein